MQPKAGDDMLEQTATPEAQAALDESIEARAAAVEALKRDHRDAFDGRELQKQLAGRYFEADPKRKAKVEAFFAARARGENVSLDLEPELEDAEQRACVYVSRRVGDQQGYELLRRRGITYVLGTRAAMRRGRSSRPATNSRSRGSRRSSSRRSSERSGDSGSEDGESEPPHAGRRGCACGCGRPRKPGAYYYDDECRKRHARERKRLQRARDRETTERHVVRRRAAGDLEAGSVQCECQPQAAWRRPDQDGDLVCVLCGRLAEPPSLREIVNCYGIDPAVPDPATNGVSVRPTWSRREWRTRPSRSEAARLRKTLSSDTRDDIKRKAA